MKLKRHHKYTNYQQILQTRCMVDSEPLIGIHPPENWIFDFDLKM